MNDKKPIKPNISTILTHLVSNKYSSPINVTYTHCQIIVPKNIQSNTFIYSPIKLNSRLESAKYNNQIEIGTINITVDMTVCQRRNILILCI